MNTNPICYLLDEEVRGAKDATTPSPLRQAATGVRIRAGILRVVIAALLLGFTTVGAITRKHTFTSPNHGRIWPAGTHIVVRHSQVTEQEAYVARSLGLPVLVDPHLSNENPDDIIVRAATDSMRAGR